ncbi:MAG: hypothetical protein ACXADC_09740 [Candidatus Thorarchaeota archaeon]|jgi:hypothetical protein
MNEVTSEIGFDDVARDPNFLLIVIGAVIWVAGGFVPLIGPLIECGGFVLTIFATASTAAVRPTKGAWPGLLMGSLLYVIGLYLPWFLLGVFSFIFIIPGTVLILFFAIPLALKYSNVPLMRTMQDEWESRSKKREDEPQET